MPVPHRSARRRGGGGGGRNDDVELGFVLDLEGDQLDQEAFRHVEERQRAEAAAEEQEGGDKPFKGLLLPDNVHVLESNEVDPATAAAPGAEEGVDADQTVQEDISMAHFDIVDTSIQNGSRYYVGGGEEEDADATRNLQECPTCGETGHTRRDCPHTHCLSCGALDEHTSRECPLSILCHRCGLAGHISRNCPNRGLGNGGRGGNLQECTRCGGGNHADTACPTLWRIYRYIGDAEHHHMRAVEAARQMRESDAAATKGDEENQPRQKQKGRQDERDEQDMDETSDREEDSRAERHPTPRRDWDPAVSRRIRARGFLYATDC